VTEPPTVPHRTIRWGDVFFPASWFVAASLVIGGYFDGRITASAAWGYVFVIVLIATALVVVHELAHIVVAVTCGFRVLAVQIGSGPLRRSTWIGSTQLMLGRFWFPLSGVTYSFPLSEAVRRSRSISLMLAGPVADLAWLIAGFLIGGPVGSLTALIAVGATIGDIIVYPSDLRDPSVLTTDGTAVIRLLRETPEQRRNLVTAGTMAEALGGLARGDYESAIVWSRRALERAPQDPQLHLCLVWALTRTRRFRAAQQESRVALEHASIDPVRPLILNNLAWVDLMIGDPADLPEALSSAREAYASDQDAAFAGTLGYALIESGDLVEGRSLIEASAETLPPETSREDRAVTAALRAIAAYRAGDPAARGFLEDARRLGGDPVVLVRAEAELAQPVAEP
jgi:Flp pilus assembly protein TadD